MARIGIDLDGVCYPFDLALSMYLRYHHGWKPESMPTPENWHFYRDWGMTETVFNQYCNEAVDAGYLFRVCDPWPDVAHSLERLRNSGHSIHIVTARDHGKPGFAHKDTLAWLHRWSIPHDSVTFSRDKTIVRTDWFIDDNIDNCLAVAATGSRGVLMSQPWNRDAPDSVVHVNGMDDFADLILGTL